MRARPVRGGVVRAIALSLLLPAGARADGLEVGPDGLPPGLLWIPLTAEQGAPLRDPLPDGLHVVLTPEQQDAVAKAFGVRPRWMDALSLRLLLSDCVCGSLNIAVLERDRVGVVPGFVSLALSWEEERQLQPDPAHADLAAPALKPRESLGPVASIIRTQRALALARELRRQSLPRFSREPVLGASWVPARVETGGPAIWSVDAQSGAVLSRVPPTLQEIAVREEGSGRSHWPGTGAVSRSGDDVLLLLAQATDRESEGRFAAWLVLRYVQGRLVQALLLDEAGVEHAFGFAWDAPGVSLDWQFTRRTTE